MARFGRDFVRAATQPAYLQGLFTAAQQVGSAPRRRREEQKETERKAREKGMLAGLTPGTPEYSRAVATILQEQGDITQAATMGTTAAEQQRIIDEQKRIDQAISNLAPSALMKAARSSDPATAEANVRTLIDTRDLTNLREYLKPATPAEFTLSEGQVRFRGTEEIARVDKPTEPVEIDYREKNLVNPDTGITEAVRIGYKGNEEVSRSVMGVVPSRDGAGGVGIGESGKQTLAKFFEDAGITVDLDTIEGLRQAQRAAYFNLGNASLSNSIGELIEEMKAPGVSEGLNILREAEPAVKQAQEDLILVNKFKALETLTEEDTAGASRLLQRIVTATAPNDIKAVQEMNAFASSDQLFDRIDNFFRMVITGKLSEETLREYQNTINAIEDLSNMQIQNAARRLIISGNEKEQQAGEAVLNFYGASTARVLP